HIFLGQALQQHFLIVSFMVSNFFVLILKRVQHRYKEATLRLRTRLSPFVSFPRTVSGNPCFYPGSPITDFGDDITSKNLIQPQPGHPEFISGSNGSERC
ncbi:MAG: hypothetical protein WBD99_03290, partial [Thermodesulfobacteriota bacterium]